MLRFKKLLMNPKVISRVVLLLSYFHLLISSRLHFTMSLCLFAVALNKALPRVASLEAELKTTSQALKDANIAKASAEKGAKTAEARAKKAEKALAEIAQKQSNREGAVVERLDVICTSIGSKCFILSFCLSKVTSVDMLLLAYLYFYDAAEKLGEVWKLWLESAKDPLLDAVEVLESNWRLAQDVLQ
jgi:hypothetical protein